MEALSREALSRDRNVAWYSERPSAAQLTPSARELLENYSKIPAGSVEDHVVDIHNEAWEIFPYPCIGQFRFLDLSLKKLDEYPEVLKGLQSGQRFLDLGCCFGQEIRQLVADGAPSENIYGCDLREEYITLGYKLFSDKDTLRANFISSNILDATSALNQLKGQFDIIYTGSFFHLWGYDDQVKVSKAVAALLRPKTGSMILGRQVGTAGDAREEGKMANMFQHNVESFKKMWKDIGDDIKVPFHVDASLEVLDGELLKSLSDDTRRIWFTVRRQ